MSSLQWETDTAVLWRAVVIPPPTPLLCDKQGVGPGLLHVPEAPRLPPARQRCKADGKRGSGTPSSCAALVLDTWALGSRGLPCSLAGPWGLDATGRDPLAPLHSYKGLVAEALRQLVGEDCYWQDEVLPPGYCAGSGAGSGQGWAWLEQGCAVRCRQGWTSPVPPSRGTIPFTGQGARGQCMPSLGVRGGVA